MNTTQNSKRSTKTFILWVVIYFFKHSIEMIDILSSMVQMSIVYVKLNMPSHHFLSLSQSASPVLTMPFKRICHRTDYSVSRKTGYTSPSRIGFVGDFLGIFYCLDWRSQKRPHSYHWYPERRRNHCKCSMNLLLQIFQFCRFCLCRFQTFLFRLKILSKI